MHRPANEKLVFSCHERFGARHAAYSVKQVQQFSRENIARCTQREPVLFQKCCSHACGRNGRREKKRSVHTWGGGASELHGDSNRRQESAQWPVDGGSAFSKGACGDEGGCWVARRRTGSSQLFVRERRVKEGHGVAGSKLGIGCPPVAIEQGEEVLSSSGGASGCAATLPAPCSKAMLPIGSCLRFGVQSVLPCPSQVRS